MSCQVEFVADCGDVKSLTRSLRIFDKDDPNWINSCVVSLSSCGNLLAVSHDNRLCFLTAQWITTSESNSYLISWSGTLITDITAILAAPISSLGHSQEAGPDWICIIVGLKNGDVYFYSDTGHILLTQKLDDKPVLKISCHTGSFGNDPDDVHILFQTGLVSLSGPSLFQTLRYAKTELARVQGGITGDFYVDGKNITIRKWAFLDQELINDAVGVGLELKNTYDHLLTASSFGGYDAWYRSVPPHNCLFVGVGSRPYIGYHFALEGGTTPPLQDVARAVASKIKSALPDWLGGGSASSNSSNTSETKIHSEVLSMRSGLYDLQRQGLSIAVSPERRLAAVPDSLGRVALIDIHRGLVIRLFKGYRDAQCAFVQVFEDDNRSSTPARAVVMDKRKALFLIIYTPKKGLIDIRLMQKGKKIAVFTASKYGKLLYNTHGMLGVETTYTSRKLNVARLPCVLMDPDGKIKKFVMPFHYALEGDNLERSRDLHLLKKIKQFVREGDHEEDQLREQIMVTAREFKTMDMRKNYIEFLIDSKFVPHSSIVQCADFYLDNKVENVQSPREKMIHYCKCVKLLCNLFMHLNDVEFRVSKSNDIGVIDRSDPEKSTSLDDAIEVEKTVSTGENHDLLLTETDVANLQRLLELAQENILKENVAQKVTFLDYKQSALKEFMASFDIENITEFIQLKSNLLPSRLAGLAMDIYHGIFSKKLYSAKQWVKFARASNVNPEDLIRLLVTYWMEIPLEFINLDTITVCQNILYEISSLSSENVTVSYNELSPWWQGVRDMLCEARCPLRSMIVGLLCRAVGRRLERQGCADHDDDAWETLTKETATWSLLIGKLEDISLLSIILHKKHQAKGKTLPKLGLGTASINLKYIYNHGKGSVTELTSKWLCNIGIHPVGIIMNESLQKRNGGETKCQKRELTDYNEGSEDDDEEKSTFTSDIYRVDESSYLEENAPLFEWLNLLRKQFPHSASADNLLANMCWEYLSAWQKEMAQTENLQAALTCLSLIRNLHLNLGMCSLLWVTFLKEPFEVVCKLVNKVGKLPKENLCHQGIGMTDVGLTKFLSLTDEFLMKFCAVDSYIEGKSKSSILFEKLWDNSVPALVEVAQNNCYVNDNILQVLCQISSSIFYQCKLNIKFSKPLTQLFDCNLKLIVDGVTAGQKKSLGVWETGHVKLKAGRMKFVHRLLAAAVELVTVEPESARLHTADMDIWVQRILDLAKLWDINEDFIYQTQVMELLLCGYDEMAAEVLTSHVAQPERLLEPVTALCGRRLRKHIETSSRMADDISALPPQLISFIHTLDMESFQWTNNSLESMRGVLQSLITKMSQTKKTSKYKQAVHMVELMAQGYDILGELHPDSPHTD